MDNPFNRQSQESGAVAAAKAWGQPNDKLGTGNQGPVIPKGGKFHSLHIDRSDNGYSVRTTHKVKQEKTKDRPEYEDHKDMNHVYNKRSDVISHIAKFCRDCDDDTE